MNLFRRPTGNKSFWWLVGLLAVLLALIHRNWLFTLSPLISGDWPFFSTAQLQQWFPFHALWIPYDGLGRGISQGNFTLFFSLYGWLAHIGFGFEIISRLLFFLPIAVLAPLGAFLAVRELTNHRNAAIVGAFVYSLNTYFLVIQGGHMHLSMVYALAPFAYYFALKKGPRTYFWLFTVLAVMGLYDVRMTLLVGGFAIVMSLWRNVRNKHELWVALRKISLGLVVLILINSFWILPALLTEAGPFSRDVFNQTALNWVSQADSLTLHHPFWSQYGVTDFVFQPVPYYMLFLPMIAFLPFALPGMRFKRELLFFGGAAILSIILLLQENSMFAHAYEFLYQKVPLMSMFRESTKLFFVTAFCYSAMIGLLIADLSRRGRRGWAGLSGSVVIAALLLPALPYVAGLFVKSFKKEPISAGMQAVNQTVQGGEPSRTLWVSRTPKFAVATNERPSVDALDLGERFWSRGFAGFDATAYLGQPYAPALLNFAGVGHVVVPRYGVDAVFYHYNARPAEHYASVVDRLGLPERRDIDGNIVWNNPGAKPRFYMATDIVRADSLDIFSGIDIARTTGYLFSDQQPQSAGKAVLDAIPTQTELNPFQAKYLQVNDEEITSSFTPPTGGSFDRYQTNPMASGRTLDLIKNADPTEQVVHFYPDLKNLYPSGGLEYNEAFTVSDCNNADNTSKEHNGITGRLVDDPTEGQHSLEVTARRHTACFSKKIMEFDKNANYLVAFDYKYLSGPAPRVGLYPYTQEPLNRQVAVPIDQSGTWQTYQTIIQPADFSDEMYVNIYLPTAKKQESKALFDNLRVYKLPSLPETYLRTPPAELPPVEVQTIEQKASHHRLAVHGLTQPRLFVFSETFDPNWRLSVRKTGDSSIAITELDKQTHVIANGFANAWWIDPATLPAEIRNNPGDYELVLEYQPQRWFTIGLVISGTVVAAAAGWLVYSVHRTKAKAKEQRRWR
ncbi:MAG TPA: hypothetical protein VFB59_01395 [Candidatus Saccharimonadales bacterium]|nr:hypothetical protein [Candidatus Saccharimonadales bacterium]